MGEHVHRRMKGRVIAPPTVPRFICPRSALRPELVPAHDLHTDPGAPSTGEGLVDAGASAGVAVRLLDAAEATGGKEPLVETGTSVSEGRLEALTFTGAETVKRHRKVVDPNARHRRSPQCPATGVHDVLRQDNGWGARIRT